MNLDVMLAQEIERILPYMKRLVYPFREDDDGDLVIEQFLHIGGLNARNVTSSSFVPVPGTRAAGVQFDIFEGDGEAIDFYVPL
jgi:hypothetical protein